jgi:hypothetical protein
MHPNTDEYFENHEVKAVLNYLSICHEAIWGVEV